VSDNTPKRAEILAQWSRMPMPADLARVGSVRREERVEVIVDAMLRPMPPKVRPGRRMRLLLAVAAVLCLLALGVGTGLAQPNAHILVSRLLHLPAEVFDFVRPSSRVAPPERATTAGPPLAGASVPAAPRAAERVTEAVGESAPSESAQASATQSPAAPPMSPVAGHGDRTHTGAARTAAGAADPSVAEIGELATENRLFAEAMDARRTGDGRRAVRALEALVARYPRSPLAQDAEVEQFRTLAAMGRHADAARAARGYLERYPGGFAREEARAQAEREER
jgi:hypothetical protein